MSQHDPYPPTAFYERLTELSKLKDGWLDGEGKAPTAKALKAASVLGPALPSDLKIYVYPTDAGGVQLEWDDEHGRHEIGVFPDGHLFLMTAERGVHQVNPVADALAAELHRRWSRLDKVMKDPGATDGKRMQLQGEVMGLRGALGIVLGGTVSGGSADRLGMEHHVAWMARQQEGRA